MVFKTDFMNALLACTPIMLTISCGIKLAKFQNTLFYTVI